MFSFPLIHCCHRWGRAITTADKGLYSIITASKAGKWRLCGSWDGGSCFGRQVGVTFLGREKGRGVQSSAPYSYQPPVFCQLL